MHDKGHGQGHGRDIEPPGRDEQKPQEGPLQVGRCLEKTAGEPELNEREDETSDRGKARAAERCVTRTRDDL